MSAYSADKKTLAYQLGEALSQMTDHYLLMTATPHKGDPENFCLFLACSTATSTATSRASKRRCGGNEAPFYLRRIKEALVTFPDPETGEVKKLFTKREVQTTEFELDDDEFDFYDALTRYVEDQSIKAAADDSARGRAVGFTMAMLQRRFASSIYAVRRSLERMRDKREKILDDPEAYRQEQIDKTRARRLRRPARRRAAGDHRRARRTWSPPSTRPRCARRSLELGKLIDQARAARSSARSRSKLVEARRGAHRAGHLRRPEDEAAGLHRAQGHARLPRRRWQGRPAARQAPRVGPDRHADPRRHEDRRPRHARHAHLRRARVPRGLPRSWSPPRPPAKASTSSSAGS